MFPPDHTILRELASRTTTPATVTNHLVRCSRSVIIPPYVVFRASLLGRRTYLNARYSTCATAAKLKKRDRVNYLRDKIPEDLATVSCLLIEVGIVD
jgi:hypothetical protein